MKVMLIQIVNERANVHQMSAKPTIRLFHGILKSSRINMLQAIIVIGAKSGHAGAACSGRKRSNGYQE
jgi:hypothetical protein